MLNLSDHVNRLGRMRRGHCRGEASGRPFFWAFAAHCITKAAKNLKIICFINIFVNSLIHWSVLVMSHAILVEEDNQNNVDLALNFPSFL